MNFPTLYKIDSKGKVREWRMEVEGNQYRTIAGLQDGQQVTSGWTTVEGKNVGRANETTPHEQAVAEVEAQYKKKLRGEYHDNMDDITQGAKFFKPMLAAGWEKRASKINYNDRVFVQPKLDGIRCILNRDGAWSRTGKPIVAVPHIVEAFAPIFEQYPDMVFDGELYNHDLKHDFNEIVSMVRKVKVTPEQLATSAAKVEYHVYDLPGMLDSPFDVRHLNLTRIINEYEPAATVLVETTEVSSQDEIDDVYGGHIELGYEGGIVRLNGTYEQKRSNQLIKRKDFDDEEFEIIRVEEGNGNWAGLAKHVFFRNPRTGGEFGAGLAGSKSYAKYVLDNADSYVGKQGTVQFFGWSNYDVPRFPIAKVLHEDERW